MTVDPTLIVFCVILGAAGAVCLAYAVARFFLQQDPKDPFEKNQEQQQYMQDVRMRTRDGMWYEMGYVDATSSKGKRPSVREVGR